MIRWSTDMCIYMKYVYMIHISVWQVTFFKGYVYIWHIYICIYIYGHHTKKLYVYVYVRHKTHQVRIVRIEDTATHCNTLQHTEMGGIRQHIICSSRNQTLHHTASHCNALQHTVTHYNKLQHTAANCNALQQNTIAHCNTDWKGGEKNDQVRIVSSWGNYAKTHAKKRLHWKQKEECRNRNM